jgi:hypothetical protein
LPRVGNTVLREKSNGTVNFGLFQGARHLNSGLGDRFYPMNMLQILYRYRPCRDRVMEQPKDTSMRLTAAECTEVLDMISIVITVIQ